MIILYFLIIYYSRHRGVGREWQCGGQVQSGAREGHQPGGAFEGDHGCPRNADATLHHGVSGAQALDAEDQVVARHHSDADGRLLVSFTLF